MNGDAVVEAEGRPFGAMIAVSKIFAILRPSQRGLPAMAAMAAIVIGLVAVLALTV